MVPFTRVPFWLPIFDSQPNEKHGAIVCQGCWHATCFGLGELWPGRLALRSKHLFAGASLETTLPSMSDKPSVVAWIGDWGFEPLAFVEGKWESCKPPRSTTKSREALFIEANNLKGDGTGR